MAKWNSVTKATMGNLFGEVVNDSMLEKMAEYVGRTISQKDRAEVARRLEDAGNKKTDAISHVESLKRSYGIGASTHCLVYNSTGESISLVASHDWNGHIGSAPYPNEIGNGQWAAFLHVHSTSPPSGSVAGVVYRGKNTNDQNKDYLLSWCTPISLFQSNSAYCEIGNVNDFNNSWDDIKPKLEENSYHTESKAHGCWIEAHSERGTSPTFTAKITAL